MVSASLMTCLVRSRIGTRQLPAGFVEPIPEVRPSPTPERAGRCLRVAQALVGRIANRPKGFPVLGGDPPADAEVAGVADDRLGT